MSAFFASIQASFVTALAVIAQTKAWLMLVAAVTYLATVLVTTFGVSVAVASGIVYVLFALLAVGILYGSYKAIKFVAPKLAQGFSWVKNKVTGLFKKTAKAAESNVVELKKAA